MGRGTVGEAVPASNTKVPRPRGAGFDRIKSRCDKCAEKEAGRWPADSTSLGRSAQDLFVWGGQGDGHRPASAGLGAGGKRIPGLPRVEFSGWFQHNRWVRFPRQPLPPDNMLEALGFAGRILHPLDSHNQVWRDPGAKKGAKAHPPSIGMNGEKGSQGAWEVEHTQVKSN